MDRKVFYRGGQSLEPSSEEVKFNPLTGLLRTTHGVSVFDSPEQVERFGGAYRLESIPATLAVIQRGRDLRHHEIVPAHPMSWDEYREALLEVKLVRTARKQAREQT